VGSGGEWLAVGVYVLSICTSQIGKSRSLALRVVTVLELRSFVSAHVQQRASLLTIDPVVGFSNAARGAKSVGYIDAFFADLLGRG
jgi:hypothetical protein